VSVIAILTNKTNGKIQKLLSTIWKETQKSKLRDGEKMAVFKNLKEIQFFMELEN